MQPLPPITNIKTIDDVIAAIDTIIGWSIAQQSRLGYFGALYKKITVAIKQAIAEGKFENGPRMQQLDVTFASRYFAALNAWFNPARFPPITQSWKTAFEGAEQPAPIIVQQLLAGVNAHIDLDLGIAAQEVAPGADLPSLRNDFNTVNAVLASEVSGVLSELDELSPVMGDFYKLFSKYEIDAIDITLDFVRADAWAFASMLASLQPKDQIFQIAQQDAKVAKLGADVLSPPAPLREMLAAVAAFESRDIVKNIEALNAQ
ncbi:MAG TPA: DUF5995 family protein [Thermoanaerobaculia bacterium]